MSAVSGRTVELISTGPAPGTGDAPDPHGFGGRRRPRELIWRATGNGRTRGMLLPPTGRGHGRRPVSTRRAAVASYGTDLGRRGGGRRGEASASPIRSQPSGSRREYGASRPTRGFLASKATDGESLLSWNPVIGIAVIRDWESLLSWRPGRCESLRTWPSKGAAAHYPS